MLPGEVFEVMQQQVQDEIQGLSALSPMEQIQEKSKGMKAKDWAKAGTSMCGPLYSGRSDHTGWLHRQQARAKEKGDAVLRKSASAGILRGFLTLKSNESQSPCAEPIQPVHVLAPVNVFAPYDSDIQDEPIDGLWDLAIDSESDSGDQNKTPENTLPCKVPASSSSDIPIPCFHVNLPPPLLKCHKLDIPARQTQEKKKENSKKQEWESSGGLNSLQAKRSHAIERHISASEMVAETSGWAKNWDGQLLRIWMREWVEKRELTSSH
ncbi:hypothetical protein C8J56DRAFT_903387 [Mycena floridula]|nr:hypothetical protein C8J56DRAFT_903387 [Mycena floridula]